MGIARWTVLVTLALALSACASNVPVINSKSKPDAGHGVVFGRMLASVDGVQITKDSTPAWGLTPHVAVLINPFDGVDKLPGIWVQGKWAVDANLLEGGYFSTILPVGRYYLVEFQFWDLTATLQMAGVRTYVSGGKSWSITKPHLLFFEVLPNRSTYLGTLMHVIRLRGNRFEWGTRLLDETDDAVRWFNTQHPTLTNTGVALFETQELPAAGLVPRE